MRDEFLLLSSKDLPARKSPSAVFKSFNAADAISLVAFRDFGSDAAKSIWAKYSANDLIYRFGVDPDSILDDEDHNMIITPMKKIADRT